MNVTPEVQGADELRLALTQLVKSTRAQLRQELNRAAKSVAKNAKKKMPKPATGTLRQSEKVELATATNLESSVAYEAAHAPFVEGVYHNYKMGRAPGRWPPVEPIKRWAIIRGIPAKWFGTEDESSIKQATFLIRRKIGQKGTPAKPFLKPAYDEEEPTFKKNMDRIVEQASKSAGVLLGRS